jgi:Tfp pilus assembly protein PilN
MIAFCTILAVSSMCVAAYLYFGFLKEAETARDIAKEQYDNLAPMAKYADDLEREKLEYMKRSDVIKEIETTRILWTKKLDQLMAVVNNNGDIDRHWVWLKELKIAMGGSRVNGMNVKGFTVGDQYEQLSNFNEHLKQHELYHNDFISISNPTGSIVYDKKMNPTTAIEFAWDMQLSDKRVK